MNVKTEITLSEEYLRYAERMVEEGAYPSVSSVVEAGLAQMMLEKEAPADAIAQMVDEVGRRVTLPREQWLPWDGNAMAERVKAKLVSRHQE